MVKINIKSLTTAIGLLFFDRCMYTYLTDNRTGSYYIKIPAGILSTMSSVFAILLVLVFPVFELIKSLNIYDYSKCAFILYTGGIGIFMSGLLTLLSNWINKQLADNNSKRIAETKDGLAETKDGLAETNIKFDGAVSRIGGRITETNIKFDGAVSRIGGRIDGTDGRIAEIKECIDNHRYEESYQFLDDMRIGICNEDDD